MKQQVVKTNTTEFFLQELSQVAEAEYVVKGDGKVMVLVTAHGTTSVNGRVHVRLVGERAEASILGAFVSAKDVAINLETLQQHEAESTTSNLLVKSILTQGSRFIYNGAIRVEESGQKTDAYQRNENLLLSQDAYAESKPSLEILADDVRCTHGATIGTLDDEQLWYLQSRGISWPIGKRLIVEGFLDTVLSQAVDQKTSEAVKNFLWQTLSEQQL
jgi:Fe-S cluster assembly protein SufD